MFCKNCGAMIPDGVNFCPACGTATGAAQAETRRSAGPESSSYDTGQTAYDTGQTAYDTGSSYSSYSGAPVQNRNIVLCIVLSIITCGIYAIYWQIVLVNDFNIVTEEPQETSGGMVFLFSLITCGIYQIYWMYKAGNRMDNLKVRLGRERESRGVVYLLLTLFGLSIVAYALIQNELNKIADGTY